MAVLTLFACGGSSRDEHLGRVFSDELASEAQRRAPEIFREALAAREAADQADDPIEKSEMRTIARLRLAAALVKVESLELRDATIEVERNREGLSRELARRERRYQEVLRIERRSLASTIAADQADLARGRAAEDEVRIFGSENQRRGLHQDAAGLLRARVRFALAVCEALGASADETSAVRTALAEARAEAPGSPTLQAVDLAHRRAQELLGRVRRRSSETSGDRRDLEGLEAEVARKNLRIEQLPEALIVDVPDSSAVLIDLLRVAPPTPVLIWVRDPQVAVAEARVASLEGALQGSGVASERIGFGAGAGPGGVTLVLVNYPPR